MGDNRARKLLDSFVDRLKANKRLEIAVYCGLGRFACCSACRHTEGKSKRRRQRILRRFSRTTLSRDSWIR